MNVIVFLNEGVHHEVNVKQVVTDIRKQRSGMVQTELQYKFIYDTLQYYIEGVIAKQGAEVWVYSFYSQVTSLCSRLFFL